jgi:hypothetical protein
MPLSVGPCATSSAVSQKSSALMIVRASSTTSWTAARFNSYAEPVAVGAALPSVLAQLWKQFVSNVTRRRS